MSNPSTDTEHYNHIYKDQNFYKHRGWIFRPFIQALAKKAQLPEQCQMIDLGCGQGFFTSLFAEQGFNSVGVDLSPEAIKSATQR